MSKPPGKCIFCEGRPLCKEHIFAAWMHPYLSFFGTKTNHLVTDLNNGVFTPRSGKLSRPGNLYSQRLRIVCDRCNNEWMSRLQTAAKPILIDLMQGSLQRTSRQQREILSRWVAMTFMVAEFAEAKRVATSRVARHVFHLKQIIPKSWSIYVGRHLDEDKSRGFFITALGSNALDPTGAPNGFIGSISIAKTLFHVVASPPDFAVVGDDYGGVMCLSQIWPTRFGNRLLGPIMTNEQVNDVPLRLRGAIAASMRI